MKSVIILLTVLFAACSTQPEIDDRQIFISAVRSKNFYWVNSASEPGEVKFDMDEQGAFTDLANETWEIESMVTSAAASYVTKQRFPDGTTETLYTVCFLGTSVDTGKDAFALGNPINTYSSEQPDAPLTEESTAAEIAAWKAWYRKVFVKGNFSTTLGSILARER